MSSLSVRVFSPLACALLSLSAAALSARAEVKPLEVTVPKAYTNAAGKVLLYRLAEPAKVEAGKKYPLVVFMHGAGERGNDNEAQLKNATRFILSYMREKGADGYFLAALWTVNGNIRYREYPDLMHWCWDQTYSDNQVMKWLFSQRKE